MYGDSARAENVFSDEMIRQRFCAFVLISTCISLLYYHSLQGIREGTVLAAVLVGLFVQIYNKKLLAVDRILSSDASAAASSAEKTPLVITIERELGSGGHEIGERIAKELGIAFYDYALIAHAAEQTGISPETVQKMEERLSSPLFYGLFQNGYATTQAVPEQDAIFLAQSKVIEEYAAAGSCVIVGRLGSYVLRSRANCFHVFITADESFRAERIRKNRESEREALLRLRREDAFRKNYCRCFTGEPWGLARHYALCINTSVHGIDGAVQILRTAIDKRLNAGM